jgi:cation diffusion facilitator family transporter
MDAEGAMAETSPKTVVYAALAGNLLVAATKIVAATWTGSSAMWSESVHSAVDSVNELLLLYGIRRARKRPDAEHPLGHGRELFFWSFIVALLVFALGSGVSLYEGISHIAGGEPIVDPKVNYIVLTLAFLFEGASWLVSYRKFKAVTGDLGLYEAFRRSKDPPLFIVLLEDTAALVGILIAAAGTYFSVALREPALDGVGSILIGLVLGGVAMLLARESKSLLIGERANRELSDAILRVSGEEPGVTKPNGVLTVQLAPDQIVAALSVQFEDALRVPDIEAKVVSIENRIRAKYPEVIALFIKPQTGERFRELLQTRYGDNPPLDGVP